LGQPSAEALPKLPLVAVVPDIRVLRSVATFYRLDKENEWFKKTLQCKVGNIYELPRDRLEPTRRRIQSAHPHSAPAAQHSDDWVFT
jgi:hypothetical protein